MQHSVDFDETDDVFFDDNEYIDSYTNSNNKAKQKKSSRTRRQLEDRMEARRLRHLLDDYTDY